MNNANEEKITHLIAGRLFGVRRLAGALFARGARTPLDQSADKSAHSKELRDGDNNENSRMLHIRKCWQTQRSTLLLLAAVS